MASKGFILLQRQILDWEWWTDINTYRLWSTILLLANFEDKKWRGIDVKRGQLLTSLESLSKKSGLSVRSVRTALNHLISTGEITCETTNHYTLITVEKYDTYQLTDIQSDKQKGKRPNKRPTKKRQATDKRPTTTNKLNTLNTLNTLNERNEYPDIDLKSDDEIPGLEDY